MLNELYLKESNIFLDLEGKSKEDILTTMSENLRDQKLVKDSFKKSIIAREAEFATGLPTKGFSVAIPHTDVDHVLRKTISVAILKEPVPFGVMGDPNETTSVKIVFMLAMDESQSQLSLLQQLMQIFQSEETLKYLANETNRADMKNFLAGELAVS